MKTLYTAQSTAENGRNGHVKSSDGVLNLDLSMPKELQGEGGSGTNPEQLFAAGYAACFGSALELVAKKKNVSAEGAKVTAKVSIGSDSTGGFQLAVELDVAVPNADKSALEELVKAAHEVCPYSKATRGNIDVKLNVVD